MTREVLWNLCVYDKRYPDYLDDRDNVAVEDTCYCDNCYYGRNKLALVILKLIEETNP